MGKETTSLQYQFARWVRKVQIVHPDADWLKSSAVLALVRRVVGWGVALLGDGRC